MVEYELGVLMLRNVFEPIGIRNHDLFAPTTSPPRQHFWTARKVRLIQLLKVVVHVIIIDQSNQIARLYEIEIMWRQSAVDRSWPRTFRISANPDPDHRTQNAESDQGVHCFLILQKLKG